MTVKSGQMITTGNLVWRDIESNSLGNTGWSVQNKQYEKHEKGLFVCSADPPNEFYKVVLEDSKEYFDQLIVFVENSDDVTYHLDLECRMQLARQEFIGSEVITGPSVVDACLTEECECVVFPCQEDDEAKYIHVLKLIKEIRLATDDEVETRISEVDRTDLEYLATDEIVWKTLYSNKLDQLGAIVSRNVKSFLERKILNRVCLGVSGEDKNKIRTFAENLSSLLPCSTYIFDVSALTQETFKYPKYRSLLESLIKSKLPETNGEVDIEKLQGLMESLDKDSEDYSRVTNRSSNLFFFSLSEHLKNVKAKLIIFYGTDLLQRGTLFLNNDLFYLSENPDDNAMSLWDEILEEEKGLFIVTSESDPSKHLNLLLEKFPELAV